ncbi:MAG: hypothetical protein ABSH32_33800 [Bryobacteraceae bacterium]|jgi:hypothetical protein
MAPIRELASFPGVLLGEGQEARCTVFATKASLPGAPGVFEYVDYDIPNASKVLPNGIYLLVAQGKTITVRYQNGSRRLARRT